MDFQNRIREHFTASIELQMQSMESLLPQLLDGARLMVEALLEEKRIFACGSAESAALAHYFSGLLLNRFERERPPLPALALGADLSGLGMGSGSEPILIRQLKAHGQAGDVLLLISPAAASAPAILQAAETAYARGMKLVLLTGQNDSLAGEQWQEGDVEICVPSSVPARIQEVNLLLLHCLCDLIDTQLFGAD